MVTDTCIYWTSCLFLYIDILIIYVLHSFTIEAIYSLIIYILQLHIHSLFMYHIYILFMYRTLYLALYSYLLFILLFHFLFPGTLVCCSYIILTYHLCVAFSISIYVLTIYLGVSLIIPSPWYVLSPISSCQNTLLLLDIQIVYY